jgi:hypothetical protein
VFGRKEFTAGTLTTKRIVVISTTVKRNSTEEIRPMEEIRNHMSVLIVHTLPTPFIINILVTTFGWDQVQI